MMRLRRAQLYKVLDNRNIPYPPGAPKTAMLKLLEANGVDLNERATELEWAVIEGRDEHGNPHREFYPVEVPHESARLQAEGVQINYEKIIKENADRAEQQEQVIDDQAVLIKQLMARLSRLEENQVPLASLTPPQLKKIAKGRGLDITGLKTKAELLELLDDGEGTAGRSQRTPDQD